MSEQLDRLDLRILKALQKDCTLSAGVLAELCGTTESTALRRRKRLVRSGAIERQIAIVDPAKVGWPLTMIVNIRIERDGPNNTIALIRTISRHEAVAQFFHVTGSTDYVAILRGRSMADFEDFLGKVLGADPRFATQSNVVIRTMTERHEVPL
jgi:Lrp/AsnC family transcriptional regulator, leucine-responsive regulatory protein